MEKKIKHLEMIEAIIERMAKNSLQLKEWTMVLVVLIVTISTQSGNKDFIFFGFIPIIGFWYLDSFYLLQERKYKELYKIVAKKEENDIDFSLDTKELDEILDCSEKKRICICRCISSTSEIWFYSIIAVSLIVLFNVLKNVK